VRLHGEKGYANDFAKWNYNPAKVESLMRAHNCSKGGDGIYSCNGTKVSFLFESTSGNALRTLAFTIFQDQAQKAGIELRNGFVPAGTLFGSHLPDHNFDLAMFTQLVTVDPHYVVSTFSCGSASNYTHRVLQPNGDEVAVAVRPGAERCQATCAREFRTQS
jgi:ABC-type transport system substrate-binding protein